MRSVLVPALAVAVLVACGSTPDAEPTPDARLFLPEGGPRPAPVVVLVPGGGWSSADPSGMVPLAELLADGGNVAVTTSYRTAATQTYFPHPVADVLCATASAVARAAQAGHSGGPVVLVGHSAGAPLALLAALRTRELAGQCEDPAVTPDAVVGLAGAYDVRAIGQISQDLFGVPEQEDPDLWKEGDVLAWAGERPGLPVLLVHGDADAVVPLSFSQRLRTALRDGGHPVELEVLAGADHLDVFRAEVVGSVLTAWLRELAS